MGNQVLNSKGEIERKEIKQKSQKSVEICLNLDKDNKTLYKGNRVLQDEKKHHCIVKSQLHGFIKKSSGKDLL